MNSSKVYIRSNETRDKISSSRKGCSHSVITKEKISQSVSKHGRIAIYKKGVLIGEYVNPAQAAHKLIKLFDKNCRKGFIGLADGWVPMRGVLLDYSAIWL